MIDMIRDSCLGAVTFFVLSAPALSYQLLVEGGQLVGASGVSVNGGLYDVAFRDGTCAEFFGGCDEDSDFLFSDDLELGRAANSALMDQVLVDGPQGAFDSNPALTSGCSAASCQTSTPVFLSGGGSSIAVLWVSNGIEEFRDISTGSGAGPRGIDTRLFTPDGGNYAVWSTAVVPIPAASLLFASGLIGLFWGRVRRRVTT